MADAEKALGNEQFKVGNYDQAIVHFSKAIDLGATHVLYSNRSACYAGLGKWDEALKDAESCIEKSPTWAKVRRGAAPITARRRARLLRLTLEESALERTRLARAMPPGVERPTPGGPGKPACARGR